MTNPKRSRSEIGRANVDKARRAERSVVSYYRSTIWPGAERTVRTGYRVRDRAGADLGDIDGTPGVISQVKCTNRSYETLVPSWLAETEAQRLAANADLGVLVVNRVGRASPAHWWAYLRLGALAELLGIDLDRLRDWGLGALGELQGEPVRLELGAVVRLLRLAGYGIPLLVGPDGHELAGDELAELSAPAAPNFAPGLGEAIAQLTAQLRGKAS